MLGIGFSAEDIFCTSIEDMAIKNGEDIRKHIHTNIQNVDFSILLISQHYKKSEICINEMGAVWAYNNNVRLYLLPDVDFPDFIIASPILKFKPIVRFNQIRNFFFLFG